MMDSHNQTVRFVPAPSFPYECTIHTLEMRGDDGRAYLVVLDLIRTGRNLRWQIQQDSYCLRAAVVDTESRTLVASKFVVAEREDFARTVGQMHLMDEHGRIAFTSADLRFDLNVTLFRALLPLAFGDALRHLQELFIPARPAERELHGVAPLQLTPEDFPRTALTGFVEVKVENRTTPLRLTANGTLGTMSHHLGNSLAEFAFVTSVPRPGRPSVIAVLTRQGVAIDLGPQHVNGQVRFGYLIRTDGHGHSTLVPLRPRLQDASGPGHLGIGAKLFGPNLDVEPLVEIGSVRLNDGALLAKTYFGRATLHEHALLSALGLASGETFEDVLIDFGGYSASGEPVALAPASDVGS